MSIEADYGSWKSPLTSKLACDASIIIYVMHVDSKTPGTLYWSELHPHENGRTIIYSKSVKDLDGDAVRWTPAEYSVHTTVHEYGGGAFFVNNGNAYFMNIKDHKIYQQGSSDSAPNPVTKRNDALYRYADGDYINDTHYFVCVREDHSQQDRSEPENLIVCINEKTGEEIVVTSGYDFYMAPRISKDGKKLAWVQWKHPNMPWDDTELWVCDVIISDGTVSFQNQTKVVGEEGVNYMQPRWTCDNKLMYISDKTGYWNLYLLEDISNNESARNVLERDEEIGGPCWKFGSCSYSPHPTDSDKVAVIYSGKPSILSISTGNIKKIDVGDATIKSCLFQPTVGDYLYMNAVNSIEPAAILVYNASTEKVRKFHKSGEPVVSEEYLSKPEVVKFNVKSVDDENAHAYGLLYKPKNKDYHAPDGQLPPLLVKIHGGPTACASRAMDLVKQYFTSRGFAILDVNYRGSTGYGTKFRNALRKKWGVYDIEDACAGALYLANDLKIVDKNKLLISGGSAGGYTTLASLTFQDVFACGASHYGVSDLVLLAAETHKFESRYLDMMIGEYPKDKKIYEERSPINYLDQFNAPCAFFQGEIDKIVPPNQAVVMFEALKKKGLKTAYVNFPDEAHGFRKSENKQKALDGEFYFYSVVLGFKPADEGIEIDIENL